MIDTTIRFIRFGASYRVAVLPFVFAVLFFGAVNAAEYDLYSKAAVIWQAEEPTCFPTDVPFPQQMEGLDQFTVGGTVTEPRKLSGPYPTRELFEGIEISTALPVMELVINAQGEVESVVAIRPTKPDFDARLAQMFRQWRFEPSTLDGMPVCTRFIVTTRINWQ